MSLLGKPLLLDRLDAELAPRVAELIAEDNARAKARREARAKRRAEAQPSTCSLVLRKRSSG